MPSIHERLAELRRILHDIQEHDPSQDDLALALSYVQSHLTPAAQVLVEKERLDALEALSKAAMQHYFLGWSEGKQGERANRDLWGVCAAQESVLGDLVTVKKDEHGIAPHGEQGALLAAPRVHVQWVGLRVEFPAAPGVSGQRDSLGWAVVEVDGRLLVRLYCEGSQSHEFWAKPGASWRPSDAQALRYSVSAPIAHL